MDEQKLSFWMREILEREGMKMRRQLYSPFKFDSDGVDRISQLPDEVLTHLIAFLPLDTAGATSLLSRRWTRLWKDIPNLIFNNEYLQRNLYHLFGLDQIWDHLFGPDQIRHHLFLPDQIRHLLFGPDTDELRERNKYNKYIDKLRESRGRMNKYIDWVNSVLRLHRAPILDCFTIAVLVDESNQHHVTKWLEFAFSRRVKRLKLISDKSWTNAGVLVDMLMDMSTPSSDFSSLRELRLKGFRMSSEAIDFFLGECAMLECLVLKMLYLTSDLEVVSGSLKHLDMRSPFTQSSGSVKACVKVRAPNLTHFTVDYDTKKVLLENVPNLVNMTFYCRTMDTMHDFASVAAQLEALTIVLIRPLASFSVPEMPKLKKLVVYYSLHEEGVLFPVTRLVRASPALEEFKMEIGEVFASRDIFQIPEDDDDDPPLHRHLRRFVLSGLCDDRFRLVEYMASYCVALEEIVVGREGLVRDLGNYCVQMEHKVWRPTYSRREYVATNPQMRRDIEIIARFLFPKRIRLRVV